MLADGRSSHHALSRRIPDNLRIPSAADAQA
jgi:hypothetical protein